MAGGDKTTKAAEDRQEVIKTKIARMMEEGISGNEIARRLGIAKSVVSKYKYVMLAELRDTKLSSIQSYRERQASELSQLIANLKDVALTKVTASNPDLKGVIDAVNSIKGLLEREAKLYGLDAPSKIEFSREEADRAIICATCMEKAGISQQEAQAALDIYIAEAKSSL